MPDVPLSSESVDGIANTSALVDSQLNAVLSGTSFIQRGSLFSSLLASPLFGTSYSTVLVGGSSARIVSHSPINLEFTTDSSVLSTQYPVASVIRTADEIANVLRLYVPNVACVSSRELPDPWEGGYPLLLVSPSAQRVHQTYVGGMYGGLAGNTTGMFNRYAIRYVGLPTTRDISNTTVQEAQAKFWYTMELVIRALKKDSLGSLGGTVIRVGDEIDALYTEGGSQVVWRAATYIGGLLMVSVMELFRPYGL